MKGYIRKRGNTYSYTVDIGRDPLTGKRKQKTKGGFKTKKAAQEALNEVIYGVNRGTFVVTTKSTFKELYEEWLANRKIKWEITTYEVTKRTMERWAVKYLGHIKLQDLNQSHGHMILEELTKKICNESARKVFAQINQVLYYAVDTDRLTKNPFSTIPYPKLIKTEKGTWTFEDLKKVQAAAMIERPFYYNIITFAAFTGMRKGEILGLREEDVDFEERVVTVRQALKETEEHSLLIGNLKNTSSYRQIALDDVTVKVLKDQIRRNKELKLAFGEGYHDLGIIFSREDGYYFRPSSVNRPFNRLAKKAGVPQIRFHDLRHTHATLLLELGTNPKLIAERLGHKDVRTTLNTYSHVTAKMQEKAINDFTQAYKING